MWAPSPGTGPYLSGSWQCWNRWTPLPFCSFFYLPLSWLGVQPRESVAGWINRPQEAQCAAPAQYTGAPATQHDGRNSHRKVYSVQGWCNSSGASAHDAVHMQHNSVCSPGGGMWPMWYVAGSSAAPRHSRVDIKAFIDMVQEAGGGGGRDTLNYVIHVN